jgi:hypothetical protein
MSQKHDNRPFGLFVFKPFTCVNNWCLIWYLFRFCTNFFVLLQVFFYHLYDDIMQKICPYTVLYLSISYLKYALNLSKRLCKERIDIYTYVHIMLANWYVHLVQYSEVAIATKIHMHITTLLWIVLPTDAKKRKNEKEPHPLHITSRPHRSGGRVSQ